MHLGAVPFLAELDAERCEQRQQRRYLVPRRRVLVDRVGEDIPELQRILVVIGADGKLRIGEIRRRVVASVEMRGRAIERRTKPSIILGRRLMTSRGPKI